MAKIKLSEGGFSLIPEGVTVFKIVGVEYKEDFGKMKVELQTKSGAKQFETFSLLKANNEVNEGALKAFSYFAKTALNNYSLDEIDESDLVGCYIQANVTHETYTRTKGEHAGEEAKTARLKEYAVAVGFGGDKAPKEDPEDDLDDTDDDLDDFLND